MNITLKQLRYFVSLAEQQHFGRAAAVSAISQPALSVQIRDLESTLGQPLFERSPKQVRLTDFGMAFETRAVEILRLVDDLGDFARAATDLAGSRLRLGVIPTIAPYLLPKLLPHLARELPDLDIGLRETLTPKLIEELSEGKIDAALVALPIEDATLEAEPLFDEAMVLVRHESEAARNVPSTAELRSAHLLMLEDGHCFRDQALDFCQINAETRRDGLDGSSLSTLVQMVGAGFGMTLIPEMAVAVETPSAAVTTQRFGDPEPARTVGLVWRKTTPLADFLRSFAEIVKETAPAQVSLS